METASKLAIETDMIDKYIEINFRKTYEHSAIGASIVSLEGKWLDVNNSLTNILGYAKEELLEIDFQTVTHPEDLEKDLKLVKKLLKNELQSYEMEKRYIHKNGHIVWALLNVSLIRDSDNNPLYFISQVQDITKWKEKEFELRDAIEHKNLLNDQLRNTNEEIEKIVRERTSDFQNAIEALRVEIENRKKYQSELEESEQKFLDLYDNAPDMYISVDSNTAKILQCNQTLASNLGYSKEEITGMDLFHIYHPDCHGDVEEGFRHFRTFGEVKDKELQLKRKDGSRIDVSLNTSAVRSESGEIIRSRSNLRDISRQKELEKKLQQTIDSLSKKSSFEKVIRVISQSVHNSLNPIEVLENTVQSLIDNIGGIASSCVYIAENDTAYLKAHRGLTKAYIERAKSIPKPKGFTWKTISENTPVYCPDIEKDDTIGPAGRELGSKSYLSMPINIDGKAIGALILLSFKKDAFDEEYISYMDIVTQQIEVAFGNANKAKALADSESRLKSLNDALENKVRERTQELTHYTEELKNSNRELEQFAYVASHDLQEPLRKVKSFTELFAKKYRGSLDEKADQYIEFIVDGSSRMQKLITDLLEYSRVGRQKKEVEKINLEETVQRAISSLEVIIKESNAKIEYKDMATVLMNENDAYRVFLNLINNAIKFKNCDIDPLVKIESGEKDGMNIISVSDNGIGIEEKHLNKIFGIFERVHTKTEYQGTGIGLAICKKIIETYGGRIWVESELGKGTSFYFSIPVSQNPEDKPDAV